MGILERMGFVERTEPDIMPSYEPTYEEEECTEVNIENVSQANLIADIYNANELGDENNSIFKVEQISGTLPSTMTTEAKKASVIGTLGVFGLTVDALLTDATDRITILTAAKSQIDNENAEIISNKKNEIEEAKRLIEECEKTIAEHEKIIADSTNAISAEIKRISELSMFIGGTK